MSERKIHVCLSIGNWGYHPAAWRLPQVPSDGAMNFEELSKIVRHAERSVVDFIFLADLLAIRQFADPRVQREREQQASRLEPFSMLSALAAVTDRIGLLGTASTTYQHPYTFARRLSTLDHLSRGRAAWNLVTSTSDDEARNYGLDGAQSSDQKHHRASEFVQVLRDLFDSWDDDAWPMDKSSGTYFDREKQHDLDHKGEHFNVKGPLDTPRPPQGYPLMATAGTSVNTQETAAQYADILYSSQSGLQAAIDYVAGVRARMPKYGRAPEELKVFQGIYAIIGKTRTEAQAKFEEIKELLVPSQGLGLLISNGFPDLRHLPLDEPVPDLTKLPEAAGSDGFYGNSKLPMLRALTAFAQESNMTLRDLSKSLMGGGLWQQPVIGTANDVADVMEEWFISGAADGFNLQSAWQPDCAIAYLDQVLPELQRRGLFHHSYQGETLRDHMGLSRPQSRHAVATLNQVA